MSWYGDISKRMERRQINLLHFLDVRCHDPLPQMQWLSASSLAWHMRWGCSHRYPIKFIFRKCDFMQVSLYCGKIFISSSSFLWLCVILFKLRLCAVTETVKAASNGEFVPGRQLACFQLVNSSTDFYEIRHWGCTVNFRFIVPCITY